jgi:hypothetical protein
VHGAFGTVLWIVCITAALVAVIALISSRKTWQDFGSNHLLMDSEARAGATARSADSDRERSEEIRQMIEARNARRLRRGEEPLDLAREVARLTPTSVDPQLESEIRQLVQARNYRRTRAGKPPLDVEAEVRRELAKVQGL